MVRTILEMARVILEMVALCKENAIYSAQEKAHSKQFFDINLINFRSLLIVN